VLNHVHAFDIGTIGPGGAQDRLTAKQGEHRRRTRSFKQARLETARQEPGSAHEQCSKRRCAQGDNFHQRVELQAMARAELGAVSGEAGGWCSRALSGAASSANGKETARQKKTQAVRSSGFF
jgi:hypothetical protein